MPLPPTVLNHPDCSAEPEGSDDGLRLSQILTDDTLFQLHQPQTKRPNTEDMVNIQKELLKEVMALRRVQEQLLAVEREKLAIAKEKLYLKKKEM